MRRSSWLALAGAGVMLLIALAAYVLPARDAAPRMTVGAARAFLERGVRAVEERDTGALMRLFAPDAQVFGYPAGALETAMRQVMNEVQGHLTVTVRNVAVRAEEKRATVTFSMDVGQNTERMEAVYFPDHMMRAVLERRRTPRWLGIGRVEEWLIVELGSDPPIELPRSQ